MKKFLLFCFLLSSVFGFSQVDFNMSMTSNYDVDTLPTHSFGTFNDIWGYVDNDGREYAIMGSAAYVHFFDVTDPTTPVEIAVFPGGETTIWRDFKVYQDRVYAVSDGTTEGLMIFDVSQISDTIVKTYQSNEFFNDSHNMFIDEANGRLYAASTNVQPSGLVVLDLTNNRDQPQILGSVQTIEGLVGGTIHDLYVRDNLVYASHGNTSSFVIWDFTVADSPQYVASYVSNGYNHSNWVTEDGNTVVFAEEVPNGLPMGILDITDKANDNLDLYTYFKFPLLAPEHEGATPHNTFIVGDLVITSYYEDGVQVFDISDPNNPFTAAYFDTHPSNVDYNGYVGCWGVYPFFPSGNIIASDMQAGLFVLELELAQWVGIEDIETLNAFTVYPNPAYDNINISIETNNSQEVSFDIYSMTGQLLQSKVETVSGKQTIEMSLNGLPTGMYIINAQLDGGQISERIVKY